MSISEPVNEWVILSYYGTGRVVANPRRSEVGSLMGNHYVYVSNTVRVTDN